MSTTLERHDPIDVIEPPAGGDRFVAGAASSVVLVLLVIQVLARELIPPLAVFAGLYLVAAAVLAVRRPRWLLVVVGLLSLVHLLGSVPFFVENLAHPESPGSFITEALVALTVTVTLVGAATGVRRSWSGARRPVAVAAAVLAGLAIVISLLASLGVEGDARQDGDVTVEAVRSTFPERIELAAGTSVLWVDNQDPFHHTLVIEGTDVHQALPGSTSVRVGVDLDPGTYTFLCDVPGHETMQGTLDVR
jgi:plastocyanin